MMQIPFKRLNFSGAIPEVSALLQSGLIGLGNVVFEFERELARYLGCEHVVATDSCTSALFLCLKYDQPQLVTIPSMTVPLVANAVLEAGCRLQFSDDTQWVGGACRLGGTEIHDCAHILERGMLKEATSQEKFCFSFYPTKPIGSADGGAIATNDPVFAEWARSVSTYGRDQQQSYRNSWEYNCQRLGYKRHYTNLQAAICLEQLRRLDDTNAERARIRDRFNQEFGGNNTSLYLYRLRVRDGAAFVRHMADHGIECGVHFKPLHLMDAFADVPFTDEVDREQVECDYRSVVSLPFYAGLTESEQRHIIQTAKAFRNGQ